MRYFIYARKSKFKKESESINSQIDKCIGFIKLSHRSDEGDPIEFDTFIDEGISGKDLNRPEFQRMLQLIKNKKCDVVVAYRLDRISRSVADFAALLAEFDKIGVAFMSATENFETKTPQGKLLIYITSIFAQFEREVIAERVKDNMHDLARSGRWLGGTTPLGFESVKTDNLISVGDKGLPLRTAFRLSVKSDEIKTVKYIFDKYLELQSLNQLRLHLYNINIRTRLNKNFEVTTLHSILSNPVYCTADKASYKYLNDNNCDLCFEENECDGTKGYTAFNRTSSDNSRRKKDSSEWIIAIGKHNGIISGENWVRVQELLALGSNKTFRKAHNSVALLSGLLKCQCGAYMRPKYYRESKDGERPYAYMCQKKESTQKNECSTRNLDGRAADEIICSTLFKYDIKGEIVNEQLEKLKNKLIGFEQTSAEQISNVKKSIKECETSNTNLVKAIESGKSESVCELLQKQIEENLKRIESLNAELKKLTDNDTARKEITESYLTIENSLESFKKNFSTLSIAQKRELLRKIIERIDWNGESIDIFLHGTR